MSEKSLPGTFALVTLGCKVNQYESHALREAWLQRGLTEAASPAEADIVCVNSCAVTAGAVADVRAAIRRAQRAMKKPNIIVTGCAAEVMGEAFWDMPGVGLVVPQSAKPVLLRVGETPLASLAAPDRNRPSDAPPPVEEGKDTRRAYPPFTVAGYDRSRAVLKVQDGCSHRCTYCIVPLTRGPSRSRNMAETLDEAKRLLHAGFRELVINGINLAQYGRDHEPLHDFWDLVAFLDKELAPEWRGRARLRLSSLEPGQLGAKALKTLAKSSLVAPHLHVSLQSGCRDVLRQMGRAHYDPGTLVGFCDMLFDIFPQYGFGADILTGFPGETREQAAETEDLCSRLPFTYAHVFPYSRRPDTPAAAWKQQVAPDEKKVRAARLRTLFDTKRKTFLEACLKLPEVQVVCEATGRGAFGVNEFYIDCRIAGGAPAGIGKELLRARPVAIEGERLLVTPLGGQA